jgi:hydrogenase nickel incorporation protein HypA/HybF
MHELAIAQSIVEAVEAKAAECKAARVRNVRLKIGEASGVVADSLTFSFDMLASLDPILAGAQLLIDIVPHRARCCHCDKEFTIKNFVAQCPACQEWSNEVISGTELQILDMEIEPSQGPDYGQMPIVPAL